MLDDIPAVWHTMELEKQRRFVKLSTSKVTLTKIAPNWLQLAIAWWEEDEGYHDICYIWQRNNGAIWTQAENAILCDLYPHADRGVILQALPTRSWTAIHRQAFRLQLSRPHMPNTSGLHKYLSVRDQECMDKLGIVFDEAEPEKHAWWFSTQTSELCQSTLWGRLRSVRA